jgi:hypothetical protein
VDPKSCRQHAVLVYRAPDSYAGQDEAVLPEADVTTYRPLVNDLKLPDPGDRHVLAAAIAGRAPVIVTWNLKDFPPQDLQPYGVTSQSPDDFLSDLHKHIAQKPSCIVMFLQPNFAVVVMSYVSHPSLQDSRENMLLSNLCEDATRPKADGQDRMPEARRLTPASRHPSLS